MASLRLEQCLPSFEATSFWIALDVFSFSVAFGIPFRGAHSDAHDIFNSDASPNNSAAYRFSHVEA